MYEEAALAAARVRVSEPIWATLACWVKARAPPSPCPAASTFRATPSSPPLLRTPTSKWTSMFSAPSFATTTSPILIVPKARIPSYARTAPERIGTCSLRGLPWGGGCKRRESVLLLNLKVNKVSIYKLGIPIDMFVCTIKIWQCFYLLIEF